MFKKLKTGIIDIYIRNVICQFLAVISVINQEDNVTDKQV